MRLGLAARASNRKIKRQDNMLVNVDSLDDGVILQTDICIVGAGAAGITLARAFEGSPFKVTLLESGGFEYDQDTQSLYKGSIKGRNYYDLDVGRLRFFGGTTNHWSGWGRPLDPVDFEARDFIPHSGWPVSYSELEPYYKKSHEVLDLKNYDYTGEEHDKEVPKFFRNTFPASKVTTRIWKRSLVMFGTFYRDLLVDSANISLYLHANVIDLETDHAGTEVTQVSVATLKGKRFKVKAKVTILCAGGIEVPRLLLTANSVKPNGLGNDHDQLGRYFMLHPQIFVGKLLVDESQANLIRATESRPVRPNLRSGLSVAEAVQRSEGLPNHAVLFSSHHVSPVANIKRKILDTLNYNGAVEEGIKHVMGDIGGMGDRGDSAQTDVKQYVSFHLDLRLDHLPNPDSRLTLGEKTDAFGKREIVLDWRMTTQDFTSVRRTMEILGETFGELGMGRLQIQKWLLSNEEAWPEDSEWDHHYMGGTRMSNDPSKGVVDAHCRVHGVSNLYVASSSVFTTAGFSNPTMTIVALALRLADHIQEKLTA
jgi:choline dehydrogenase-like flavoprotein